VTTIASMSVREGLSPFCLCMLRAGQMSTQGDAEALTDV
jgi:hypothetical protein